MDTLPVAQAGPVLVVLPAEIDIVNARGVREQLVAACGPGVHVVIADMTATRFCDAAGVRALVLAHLRAAAAGTELRPLMPGPNVVRVMAVLGLDRAVVICRDLDRTLAPWRPAGGDDH